MNIKLSDEQALVLYDWLSRFDEADNFPVDDPAEEQVFWAIHGQLEKALSAQFRDDYAALVEAARKHVKENQAAG